ncbi:hypothetical protein [Paenibacillus sp. 1A_MP2]|uniref:hypothetical protein n=1 Tax=Paenibacillus sp. 1A_MP2 TaxID=3457495 RepID=UPI003FCDC1C6
MTKQNKNKESLYNTAPPERIQPNEKKENQEKVVDKQESETKTTGVSPEHQRASNSKDVTEKQESDVSSQERSAISDEVSVNNRNPEKTIEAQATNRVGDRTDNLEVLDTMNPTEPKASLAEQPEQDSEPALVPVEQIQRATNQVAVTESESTLESVSNRIRRGQQRDLESIESPAKDRTSENGNSHNNDIPDIQASKQQGISKNTINELIDNAGKISGSISDRAAGVEIGIRDTELKHKEQFTDSLIKDAELTRNGVGSDVSEIGPSPLSDVSKSDSELPNGHTVDKPATYNETQNQRNTLDQEQELATNADIDKLRYVSGERDKVLSNLLDETERQFEKIENATEEVNQNIKENQSQVQKSVKLKEEVAESMKKGSNEKEMASVER